MPQGLLMVLSGPSGCGKGTVCDLLRQRNPNLTYSISATTRKPRPGEQDGVNYRFFTREQFKRQIKEDGFLEWAEVYGNLYGTPRTWVEEKLAAGKNVLLEIDTQGAMQVKASYPAGILLFLLPPNMEELRRRIDGRGTEGAEEKERRLQAARQEIAQIRNYDYLVVNDEVQQAVLRIEAILLAEQGRISRYSEQELKVLLGG
ncbi:MAG TPA: guanylate kinase [Firmicutes bacterium]|jgi:guanylate kinase|nr:guanylate kinase [Bacillota bacterium]